MIQSRMFSEWKSGALFKKAHAHAMRYISSAFERNVFPSEAALKDLSKFEEAMPSQPSAAEDVIDLLDQYGSPATVTHIGGRYFGFVNGSVIPASLAAKNLSIFWDQNTGMQVISPIASKLETVVQQWLIDLFKLPHETVAGFVSGTSMANFCALAAARYRILMNKGWDITEKGLFDAPKIRVVTGRHAHSTILKAISLNGLGKSNIEWVDVDDQGRIKADQIPTLDSSTILILQAGNVNSGSFDNFKLICEKARAAKAWIHIDGAFGLWARATQELAYLTEGIELADSWAMDGHKTLNTPYDSGLILCRDKEALVSALHMSAGYIILGSERDGMFFTPEMSRRARVVEMWAALKYLGKAGLNEMILGFHERAVQFANGIKNIKGFHLINDVVFNQVLLCCDSDEITDLTISHIQEQRECWVGGSVWNGKKVIRVSICSWATTEEDIERALASFEAAIIAASKK
ncbi:MAG: aminotransferase class V-fold PLP-dependent enzyme [Cyclobacteriaceae bacterium]